jgi:hypothetical protein
MSAAYRFQAIRKTTVSFASLFKDIPFVKFDENGIEVERIIVPIIYGDKEKYVKRLDIPREKVQITLPRIEYGLTSMEIDVNRKLNSAVMLTGCSSSGDMFVKSPIPYNFNFELILYTRNVEDANQIMEYILTHFNPDYNMRIAMVPEAGIIKNIPVTFNGESEEQDATGSFDSPVRSVFRTLTFTARSFIYQPPIARVPILMANTNVYVPSSIFAFVLTSGTGTFKHGEPVYQGYSYDTASARGTVYDWNERTKILTLTNIIGTFANNSLITTTFNTAQYTIGQLPDNGLAYVASVVPVPNIYPPVGPWTSNTTYIDNTL